MLRVPTAARRWLVLAACAITFSAFHSSRTLFAAVLPELKAVAGDSYLQSIVLAAAYDFGYAFTLILGGQIASRLGLPATVALSLSLLLLGSAGSGLWVHSFNALFALRLLGGLGFSLYYTAGNSLLSRTFPGEERGRAYALHGTGSALGRVYGAWLAGGALMLGSVALAFYSYAWLLLIFLVAVSLLISTTTGWRQSDRLPTYHVLEVLRMGHLWRSVLAAGLAFAGFLCTVNFLPLLLVHQHQVATAQAARLMSLLNLSSIPGTLVVGWLTDRHGTRRMIPLVFGGLAAGLLLLWQADGTLALGALVVWVGFFLTPNLNISTIYLTLGGTRFSSSVVFGVFNTLALALGLVGMFVMGFMADLFGIRLVFFALAALMAASWLALKRIL